MAVSINTILSWFKTGLKPTEAQFKSTWESFWHKEETIPLSSIYNLTTVLNAKAEKSQFDAHKIDVNAHADLFDKKEDKFNRGMPDGYAPLNEVGKIVSNFLVMVNDLTTGGSNPLTAEQGKVLKSQIDAINVLLSSDDIDLDTLQEIVDKIKEIQAGLDAFLVNDLTTGGITKALTAEMGKVLNNRITQVETREIPDLNAQNVKLGSYPSTRNDGPLPSNKVLSTDASGNIKLYTIATSPAPFLEVLIPDSYLPSTTGNFILRGAYFTPNMTVAIQGQTVNYVIFISDNEVRANVTTGSAEGTFSITLNNGISSTYNNALLLTLGTIYPASPETWINTVEPITFEDSNALTKTYNVFGYSDLNYTFNLNKKFRIYFDISFTPLVFPKPSGQPNILKITDLVNGDYYNISFYNAVSSRQYQISKNGGSLTPFAWTSTAITSDQVFFHWDKTTMFIYVNGGVAYTFPAGSFQNAFSLRFIAGWFDFKKIRYVELPN